MKKGRCRYDVVARTPDCGNPYQHWEKKKLIEALLDCHGKIDGLVRGLKMEGERLDWVLAQQRGLKCPSWHWLKTRAQIDAAMRAQGKGVR